MTEETYEQGRVLAQQLITAIQHNNNRDCNRIIAEALQDVEVAMATMHNAARMVVLSAEAVHQKFGVDPVKLLQAGFLGAEKAIQEGQNPPDGGT